MRKGEPITTYTGIDFYILDPRSEDVEDIDIAHALSLMCRANGHYIYFYSVAQHCLNCLQEARARGFDARLQMAVLIHDGSEAYISDITRPVKQYLPTYMDYEYAIQSMLYEHYGVGVLTEEEKEAISAVDDTVLFYEFEVLHKRSFEKQQPEKKAEFDFSERSVRAVEEEFLRELKKLSAALLQ
ncbi:MAG: phosphohydrolase [Ruminococcaceae bacterium]|nr:phosphohydrolase [Oscillospiraceae bacterium]